MTGIAKLARSPSPAFFFDFVSGALRGFLWRARRSQVAVSLEPFCCSSAGGGEGGSKASCDVHDYPGCIRLTIVTESILEHR